MIFSLPFEFHYFDSFFICRAFHISLICFSRLLSFSFIFYDAHRVISALYFILPGSAIEILPGQHHEKATASYISLLATLSLTACRQSYAMIFLSAENTSHWYFAEWPLLIIFSFHFSCMPLIYYFSMSLYGRGRWHFISRGSGGRLPGYASSRRWEFEAHYYYFASLQVSINIKFMLLL